MRLIFRAVVIVAVLAAGAYLLGLWSPSDLMNGRWGKALPATGSVRTGAEPDRLGQIEQGAGRAVQKVDAFASEAETTGKIKSKMALDEVVRASTIHVSTTDGVVTLEGTVRSVAERDQALRLARDTKGVTRVVDHLTVLP
jgi:osmotically-inducible protein OsmY